jgi:hypothetical protein
MNLTFAASSWRTRSLHLVTAAALSAVWAVPASAIAGPPAGSPPTTASAPPTAPAPAGDPAAAAVPPEGEVPAEPPAEEPTPAPEPAPEPEDASREAAKEAFFEGTKAYALGKYEQAIAMFEKAYELSDEPTLLFNLGQAYWKRYDVSRDIEDLRRAKAMFVNYDKFMRQEGGEEGGEMEAILKAVQAQLDAAERELENQRLAALGKGPSSVELREEQRRRQTAALNGSGIAMIVAGSLGAGIALGGGVTRGVSGWMLSQAEGEGVGTTNTNTREQDARQRAAFLTGGQLAFSGVVIAAVLLPVGIGLKVAANMRTRNDIRARERREREIEERMRLTTTSSGFVLEF